MSPRFHPVGRKLPRLSVSPFMGTDSQTPVKRTAEQVIEKNVAARGGLQAWRMVQNLSLRGKMEAGGNDSKTRPVAGDGAGATAEASRTASAASLSLGNEARAESVSRN
jgi:hypothetical protein